MEIRSKVSDAAAHLENYEDGCGFPRTVAEAVPLLTLKVLTLWQGRCFAVARKPGTIANALCKIRQ